MEIPLIFNKTLVPIDCTFSPIRELYFLRATRRPFSHRLSFSSTFFWILILNYLFVLCGYFEGWRLLLAISRKLLKQLSTGALTF
jgi:hypothetical protein